ncbi:transmembrane protein 19 [Lates japonicus]|uniref:Transmembrane protein 19 n=1 Tax=Lates japonicus TaxID=270547 RepID=A0AAD3NGU2_LATJO|nr:transmembrane protein 19 [Lates japonicus]
MVYAGVAGLVGSMLDSFLGAHMQYSGFDSSIGKVFSSPSSCLGWPGGCGHGRLTAALRDTFEVGNRLHGAAGFQRYYCFYFRVSERKGTKPNRDSDIDFEWERNAEEWSQV